MRYIMKRVLRYGGEGVVVKVNVTQIIQLTCTTDLSDRKKSVFCIRTHLQCNSEAMVFRVHSGHMVPLQIAYSSQIV